ncbi:MAG: hypothetical protein A3F40_00680 [Chlamydiae bacterium RIFCSPHIGHO2_12_FULL_27_8]|nr:MAG: hypothetical protein A3F40_00680 [Chlamydiae bacterium RIFCSPHIGHO2_12_FULL_27_8]OGN65443.1 MAG: hypothetical protein A2888_01395 [Chlamydiae bacterium RIFCSPLOWO2_01_FULL_28_7]
MRASLLHRFFDYYLGIFLVYFLSFFKKKIKKPDKYEYIGLLKPVALGDLTLISGILIDLKKNFPKTKVILFAGKDNSILVPFLENINQLEIIDVKRPFLALQKIRKYKIDLLIDFCSWPRINALLTFFSNCKYSIGFKTKGQNRHYLYDEYVIHSSEVHEIQNYRNLLKVINLESNSDPKIIFNSNNLGHKNHVIFHLFAGGSNSEKKEWSFESWKNILKFFEDKNIQIYLTGSKSDFDKNQNFINYCSYKNIINFSNQHFENVLEIIKTSALVISVNTGIMHIAAALEVPTIGLSGPTNINRWGAIGKHTVNIEPKVMGCGYLNLGFEYKNNRNDCMQFIDKEDIIMEIKKIIK